MKRKLLVNISIASLAFAGQVLAIVIIIALTMT
jgi:hypothetical protein